MAIRSRDDTLHVTSVTSKRCPWEVVSGTMSEHIQVATTTENKGDAQRIAAALVNRRLAACVQVHGPIDSTYRWQGRVETAEEWGVVAKSRGDLFEKLQQAIRELHAYDEPEIVATAIIAGSPGYLQWIDDQLADVDDDA